MINDCLVIIRSVGERTEKACKFLLNQVFPVENIVIISETPLNETLRQSFNFAIERNFPWTLCVDADVLMEVEQIPKLIHQAKGVDNPIFQIQGMIMDKFFQVWRPAGQHVYRTALLKKAIAHIPEEGLSLRPETDMLNSMSRLGYPWMQSKIRVGVHDFEQYYEDIYRKCFLHGIKHKEILAHLEGYWHANAQNDFDFELALIAAQEGRNHEGKVFIDKSLSLTGFENIKASKGFMEKPEFNIDSLERLSQIILDAKRHHSIELQNRLFPQSQYKELFDLKEQEKINNPGLRRKIYNLLVWAIRSFVRKTWKK